MTSNHQYSLWKVLTLCVLALFLVAEVGYAQKGKGSFGGSRGGSSFGGSKSGGSFGGSKSGGSFGGSRPSAPAQSMPRQTAPSPTTQSAPRTVAPSQPSTPAPSQGFSAPRPSGSFGGNRLSSPEQYRKSYGIPRKSEPMNIPAQGGNYGGNYVVNSYGGMSDGFMMGYLAGRAPFMWSTPFHPAFYYSRPHYVEMPDGRVEVYPPTFSFTTLLFTLVVFGGIAYIIYVVIRNRRRRQSAESFSSFS